MFELAYPLVLLALPLPALAYFLLPTAKAQQSALKVPFYRALTQIAGSQAQTGETSLAQKILACVIWALLVLAACKPQWIGEPIPIQNEGRDLLLAVDLSESMRIQDMAYRGQNLTRIDVVKDVVADFVEKRHGDRLGLILFADNAYLQAPLTFDRQTVKQLLQEARIGFAGRSTAIGDAIALGVKRLRERPNSARVMVLLTDGENTAGELSPEQATELAALAEVKIYTVGVASDQMIDTGLGFFSRPQSASASLDEKALQAIADATGGEYFRARDTADLQTIYETLNTLEAIEQDEQVFRPIESFFHWPLAIAFILSLALALWRSSFGAQLYQRLFQRSLGKDQAGMRGES